jgi:hypothetical protein
MIAKPRLFEKKVVKQPSIPRPATRMLATDVAEVAFDALLGVYSKEK